MTRPASIYPEPRGAPSRQQVAQPLRQLMNASVAITSVHSIPEMLRVIAQEARTVIGADVAIVDFRSNDQDPPLLTISAGPDHGCILEPYTESLIQLAHSRRTPLRLDRSALKSRVAGPQGSAPHGLRGWMAAPLIAPNGHLGGAIQVVNKSRGQFTENDEFLLAQLARFAAVAIENARFYSESQRERAERARSEESMRVYRQIFASSNDAIALIDPQGMYLEQNPAHRALIGYSDEELRGRTPAIHMGTDVFRDIVRVLARTGEYRGEVKSRNRDGDTVDLDLAAFTMRNPAGEVLGYVGIKREIGTRKRVEHEIRARVRQQAAVVELGRLALGGMDTGQLMQRAAYLVAQVLENEFCKVLELQADGKTLLLRAGVGWKPGYVGSKTLSAGLGSHAGFTLVSSGPVIIDDLRAETRFSEPLLQEHGVISGMSVLIEGGERPFGVIGTHSAHRKAFTPDDVTFLRAVANVLASALERKRVDEVIRARVRQQAAVVDLGQRALEGVEVGALMDHAAQLVAHTLEVEHCKVLELLPGGKDLLLRAGVGWKEGYVGSKTIDAGLGSHAGFTLVASEPVIITDLSTETRFTEPLLTEHCVVSGISVIIEGGGHPYGVLGAHSTSPRRFAQDDVNFLQAVANVLAIVMQRSRADAALRQSEQRFHQAQRAANIGAYDWNLSTGVVAWSEELPALKGASTGTFDRLMERVLPEDRPRVAQVLRQAVAEAGDFDLEFRMIAHTGIIWVANRGQVFSDGADPAYVLGVLLDITARVRAEELLRRSEKLAAVGRLASTIAHEINNPLESVTNLLYLLEHHPGLDETAHRYASMAQQELHRVAHIARQTLSFHRESSTAVPAKLSELVENVLQLHARRIDAAGIVVDKRYEYNEPVEVFPGAIQQVLSNLVLNALEAMGGHGRLIVRLAPGIDWKDPQRRGVRVLVADTGPGIPPERRSQIFEPFFTTKGERGTGLGLWVINGIVQKHNGTIRLRSSIKPGGSFTCFSIFLPTATHARSGSPKGAAAHPRKIAA